MTGSLHSNRGDMMRFLALIGFHVAALHSLGDDTVTGLGYGAFALGLVFGAIRASTITIPDQIEISFSFWTVSFRRV